MAGMDRKVPSGDGSGEEQPGEMAAEDSVLEDIVTFSAESVPPEMAVAILEKYFGKPIEEITENDINQKLKEL